MHHWTRSRQGHRVEQGDERRVRVRRAQPSDPAHRCARSGRLGACTPRSRHLRRRRRRPDPDQAARGRGLGCGDHAVASWTRSPAAGRRARTLAGTRAVHVAHVGLLTGAPESDDCAESQPRVVQRRRPRGVRGGGSAEDSRGQTLRQAAHIGRQRSAGASPGLLAAAAAQQSVALRTLAKARTAGRRPVFLTFRRQA